MIFISLIFNCLNARAFGVPISTRKSSKVRIIRGFEGVDGTLNRTMSTLQKVKSVFNLV